MNNKSIFNEFKKNKNKKIIEDNSNVENKKEINTIKKDIVNSEIKEEKIMNKDEENLKAYNILYSNSKFKEFKESFIKDEKVKNLLLLFDKLRSDGVKIFDNDFFIYQKMKDENIKLILMEPTTDDIMLNKKESMFLVKAIYPTEYQEFIKEYKSREANPVKFLEFVISKGVLYPTIKDDLNKSFTSGEVLSLYDTIINMSDLNKRYRVIEV